MSHIRETSERNYSTNDSVLPPEMGTSRLDVDLLDLSPLECRVKGLSHTLSEGERAIPAPE